MKTVSFDFTSLEGHMCALPACALVVDILFREKQLQTWDALSGIEKNSYRITEASYEEIRLFEQEHSDDSNGWLLEKATPFCCSFMKDEEL